MARKMGKKEFYSFLKKIPKAEIHLHIEAVASIRTIKHLYKKRFNRKMNNQEIEKLFSYNDLNGFIKAFLKVQDLFQSVSDMNYIFDDLGKYLKTNNIVYCEAFFSPTAFLKKGFLYEDIISVFTKKIKQIKDKYGITVKLLLDVSRTFGCSNAMKNYNLLKEYPCKDIIGIGLGGAEQKGPAKEYASVFEQAYEDGFHTVAHAGEDVGPESIWDAINCLHAERIGHGITSIQDECLMEHLSKKQIPLEICVTSNVFTKHVVKRVAAHPVRTFFEKGVFVTINTDDPLFFKTTLIEEFWKIYKSCNFNLSEIKKLILEGFRALFINEEEKKNFYNQVEQIWSSSINEKYN